MLSSFSRKRHFGTRLRAGAEASMRADVRSVRIRSIPL